MLYLAYHLLVKSKTSLNGCKFKLKNGLHNLAEVKLRRKAKKITSTRIVLIKFFKLFNLKNGQIFFNSLKTYVRTRSTEHHIAVNQQLPENITVLKNSAITGCSTMKCGSPSKVANS